MPDWRITRAAREQYIATYAPGLGTEDAELAIRRLMAGARPTSQDWPERSGAKVWRCGKPIRERFAVVGDDVVAALAPHAGWRPPTPDVVVRRRAHRPTMGPGRLLRDRRESQGVTVDVVASLADVDVATVERLERGEGVSDRELLAVIDALYCTLEIRPRA